ncbi:GNAT family N-acetyltransferase [Paracoccus sp. Z118]|uniref:GNAT family N-acetyltransferase n=1 Tax=Paracoccus sp. Z118 TaxID=2851017 RepID=UPI001C2C1029|nr:GNAT family N-acetyltransferase [Paracoccus sp. Z118]MBV0890515.1 GNAT family N-acetyltransferase [Paracoccus sp. Z118]
MLALLKGRYRVRLAEGAGDLQAAQRLRWLAFIGRGSDSAGLDADEFDAICQHALVEETRSGQLVACFRILPFASGAEIGRSYSAQHYGLSKLGAFPGRMAEIGRFCIHPEHHDPDILRVAWGAVTRYVDQNGIELLFGCSSFTGTEPSGYEDAFAMLRQRHLAPDRWLPRIKAPDVFRFGRLLRRRTPDARAAMAAMPPLLRTYLLMGGWVSDHAVVDRELNTLHVFTGLEIRAIPPARAKLLRLVAG